jgi:MFS family permease
LTPTPPLPPEAPRSAWSYPALRQWLLVRACVVACIQLISTTVGWQVWSLTGEAVDLGLVGLSVFLPTLFLWPLTGLAADRYARRDIVRVNLVVAFFVALGLVWAATAPLSGPGPIFGLMFVLALGRVFGNPASQAMVAGLVPREVLGQALSLTSATFQALTIAGPAAAGLLIGLIGLPAVYGLAALLAAAALVATLGLPPCRGEGQAKGWGDVLDGLRYLRGRPVLLGAITLDLLVVLFGGATALLPIYATDVLHVGAEGMGLLRAAPALGAVSMALFLSRQPPQRGVGKKLLIAVAGFGLATIGFGLSTSLLTALPMLVLIGVTDEVSVMLRTTLVQVRTPDAYRGRVSAVNSVFVGISNEVGELESGLTAALLGPVGAVVAGGMGSLAVVAGFWAFVPRLREVDRVDEG